MLVALTLRTNSRRTREIQTILIDYAQAVIDDDWPTLAEDRLGQRAGALKTQLAEGVLNLKPATSNQQKMLSHILAGMHITAHKRSDQTTVTILVDRLRDQAELSGVLNSLYDLHHLSILKVEVVNSE